MGDANQSNNTQEQEVALKVGGGNHLFLCQSNVIYRSYFLLPFSNF
jgi:hypothetical protein